MLQSSTRATVVALALLGFSPVSAFAQGQAAEHMEIRSWTVDAPAPSASKLLPVLYGAYGVLQGLDVYSTRAALRNGAVEVNPVMGSMAGQTGTMLLMKAASGAATVGLVKAIEKKSRKAAVVLMVALNGVTAAVVARNMQNARR